MRCATIAVVVILAGIGCASVDPRPDFERAGTLVGESTGVDQPLDPAAEPLTDTALDAILANGLTIDEAARLALVNSRQLQAFFLEIGVAKADWVQSGLLRNPTLGLSVLLPEGGGRRLIEASIAQNIVDLWQLPIRKRIARHRLDATVLRAARRAGELVVEIRAAYYEAVAAAELLEVIESNRELLDRSYQAIRGRREAGAASLFDENTARGQLLFGQAAQRTARLDLDSAKRRLARLLSLESDGRDLELLDPLPAPGAGAGAGVGAALGDATAEQLIEIARASRLDLRAYESALRAAEVEVSLKRGRALGDIEAGAGFEREDDEKIGPIVTLEIPIFDQNQAQVARRYYLHRQAIKSYEAASLAIAQDIRTALDVARTAAENLVFYRDELLPHAQQNLSIAQSAYEAGQLSVVALIDAQRTMLETRRAQIAAHRQAATASVEIEALIGRPLP